MKKQKLLITGVHRYTFRQGETAEVVGVVWTTPWWCRCNPPWCDYNCRPCACLVLKYADGFVDELPIEQLRHYCLEGGEDAQQYETESGGKKQNAQGGGDDPPAGDCEVGKGEGSRGADEACDGK